MHIDLFDVTRSVKSMSKYPYGIRLPEDPMYMFKTLLEQELYSLSETEDSVKQESHNLNKWYRILIETPGSDIDIPDIRPANELPVKDGFSLYTTPNYTDTRVGGNDAINPYWQFNRDDDIVPKMLEVPKVFEGGEQYGMGRVYSERYDANQQILWLSMGVAEYTNILAFYMDAADKDAADTMKKGMLYGVGRMVRYIINGITWAFKFPFVAASWLYTWIRRSDSTRITKYYWFKPSMTIYYEMVNTMLSYLAVGMGLYPSIIDARRADATKAQTEKASSKYNARTYAWGVDLKDAKYKADSTGIPEILKDGPDIFVIMNRRARLFNSDRVEVTTAELLKAAEGDAKDINDKFTNHGEIYEYEKIGGDRNKPLWKRIEKIPKELYSTIKASMLGAGDFVGFRVEKSSNASESVSNETGQTGISQKLNSIAQQMRDRYEDSFGGSGLGKLLEAFNNTESGGLKTFFKRESIRFALSALSTGGLGDLGVVLADGNGYFDIPDVWKSSSFSKSYSFSVDLYSRYGDPVSIYQSIYIPMIMLLAAGLPRSIGTSMYTSPFLIKAFCKGQFAIPCGIISSISITRGKEEHGWSTHMLPTQVSVDLSMKDMTPAMFMGMGDIGLFDTFSRNEPMHEYLDTLSALGVTERRFLIPQALRKANAALAIARNTIFSSTYWGSRTGRSSLSKAIGQIPPFGNHEQSDRTHNSALWAR